MKIQFVPFYGFLLLAMLLVLPVTVQAQFDFTTNADGTLNISGYSGSSGTVVIPETNQEVSSHPGETGLGSLIIRHQCRLFCADW